MKKVLKKIFYEGEVYLGTYCFIGMTVLLAIQVISRYIFRKSVTWTEELSVILFVWMQYFGIIAAVLSRKQIRIDAVVNLLPFRLKKAALILSNVCTTIFCFWIFRPILDIISNLFRTGASTNLLRIPKGWCYMILPIAMAWLVIRLVQETILLWREDEKDLGAAQPTIDLSFLKEEDKT